MKVDDFYRFSPLLRRYERQIPLFGLSGQERLGDLSVAVIGVGGLGSFSALYLAAAGVGRLVIVDGDVVEDDNLNRQVLHWEDDIGRLKVYSALEKLRRFNPYMDIEVVPEHVAEDNAEKILRSVDAVVDALDNWEARFIVDRVAYRLGKIYVHAGVHGLEGQVIPIVPGETPCLRCLLPPSLKTPPEVPIAGFTVGIVAGIAVAELVKIVTGVGRANKAVMIVFDASSMEIVKVELKQRENCSCPA